MQLSDGFVINAENFRKAQYTISPFENKFIARNRKIIKNFNEDTSLLRYYFGEFEFTMNGKQAIFNALIHYNLVKDDEICIYTTTESFYISSCVTSEIEKFCKWSRTLTQKTKVIFIIHEFGMPIVNLPSKFNTSGLPIIEDFSMCFTGLGKKTKASELVDFKIYSLPKIIPNQYGGILSYQNDKFTSAVKETSFKDLGVITSYYLTPERLAYNLKRRKKTYLLYVKKIKALGYEPAFSSEQVTWPTVFMFKCDNLNLNLLKKFMQENGVESSVFYKENIFYLPINQQLNKFDCAYIIQLIKYFQDDNKQH